MSLPFNSSTTISYDLARPGFVRLGVYDSMGRLVRTLSEGYATAGSYRAVWNGENAASGAYYLQLTSPQGSEVRRGVTLIK